MGFIKRTYASKTSYKPRKRIKLKKTTETAWSLKKADKQFSELIRGRDGKCLFPGCTRTEMLQCSHYFGRVIKATRFDEENCISLCWHHHFKDKMLGYEYQKQQKEVHGWDGQYTLFMKKWLGEEKFAALCERARVSVKQRAAILSFQTKVTHFTANST